MIVLDTNVLSALMQAEPDTQVVAWLDRQPSESIWITAINLFEIRYGLAQSSPGKRREALQEAFSALLFDDLKERVLPFDTSAAEHAARLAGERRRIGRSVDMRDTQLAGICEARNAILATRNTRHFEDLSTPITNPWEDGNKHDAG
jgi:predicted nucleic acid-binding protein